MYLTPLGYILSTTIVTCACGTEQRSAQLHSLWRSTDGRNPVRQWRPTGLSEVVYADLPVSTHEQRVGTARCPTCLPTRPREPLPLRRPPTGASNFKPAEARPRQPAKTLDDLFNDL